MAEDSFIISCPCCGERLEIERRTGKIIKRWAKPEESADKDIMQAGLDKLEADKARLEAYFSSAGQSMQEHEAKLAKLFDEEKERIEKSGDTSKPQIPFDLD